MTPARQIGWILKRYGWDTSDLFEYGTATKVYETAVGLKTAIVYFYVPEVRDTAWITAEYQSEGRNVLAACCRNLPLIDSDELSYVLHDFLRTADKKIDESYARRLRLEFGILPDRT